MPVDCTGSNSPLVADFDLPSGFRYLPGSAQAKLDGGPGQPVSVDRSDGLSVSTPMASCSAGHHNVDVSVQAEPGIVLGPTSDSVSVSFNGDALSASDASPTLVTDNPATTRIPVDGANGPTSTMFLGHIASSGDLDTFTVPNLPAGTQLDVTLAHIPAGQDLDLSVFGPTVPALRSAPLRGSPLRGSPLRGSAVDDTSLDPTADGTSAAPEPLTDVPIQPPAGDGVWGISDNRGGVDESVSTIVPDGATGGITIVASGYNGSSSPQAYSLLVSITPPADAPPGKAVVTLPSPLLSILVNIFFAASACS